MLSKFSQAVFCPVRFLSFCVFFPKSRPCCVNNNSLPVSSIFPDTENGSEDSAILPEKSPLFCDKYAASPFPAGHPSYIFQVFSHEAIQICHLYIKAPVFKTCHGCFLSYHEDIMLIVLPMTDTAFLHCFLPKQRILRFLQKCKRTVSLFQICFHRCKIQLLKRTGGSFFTDKLSDLTQFLIMSLINIFQRRLPYNPPPAEAS